MTNVLIKYYKIMTTTLTISRICVKISVTTAELINKAVNLILMEENMKKLFSVLVVIAMLACMLPVFAVSAANPEVPVAKVNGVTATGTGAKGKAWTNTADGLTNNETNSIFVFDQEFKAGTISLKMTKGAGDNGIIFGLTGDADDLNFWEAPGEGEDSVQYYFVFINNGTGEILLAKTGDGLGWCWMKAMSCPKWDTCTEIDLKVVYNGNGHIEMWANGELAYDYCDANPLTGTRWGVRVGNATVTFTDINVTTAAPSNEGIAGGMALPFAKVGDKTLTGYFSGGPWKNDGSSVTITDTSLVHNTWATSFVIDNDTLPLTDGSLTATVRAGNTDKGANWLTGIIFGLEADRNVTVWKNSHYSPKYYTLFVDGEGKLVLSKGGVKTGDDNLEELTKSAAAVEGYTINEDFVEVKAAFKMVDGKLEIKGYANGTEMLSYTDEAPLTGSRYGFMARCAGSEMKSLVPVNNVPVVTPPEKPAPTGDLTVLVASIAALAVIGTAVVVSKKRSFN